MLVSMTDLTKYNGEKCILDHVELHIENKDKIGILGVNGTGKSTLLKMIAGVENYQGKISYQKDIHINYLPQTPHYDENDSVMETVYKQIDTKDVHDFEIKAQLGKFGILDEKQKDEILPELTEQEILESQNIEKTQHFTKPPARYSEAKLIKEMEELGIGRPSTYAMIIDTIQTRGYVELVDKTFKPTESGILTSDRLTQFFNDIINVEYTAQMEKELDDIAEGQDDYFDAIDTFIKKFQPLLDEANEKMEVISPKKTGEKCPECGHDLVERHGRYGKFIACENYPECKYIKKEKVEPEFTGENCPKCGSPMVFKTGRYGKFEACSNYPQCKYIKNSKKKAEPVMTDEVCPNCGSPVVIKKGRWGEFKACSNYPKCKTIIK